MKFISIRNNDKCQCECKKRNVFEKDYVWNPSLCNCGNGKYLASIIDDSAIACDCDQIIESYKKERKLFQQILMKKNITCKTQNFCILLALLLVMIYY